MRNFVRKSWDKSERKSPLCSFLSIHLQRGEEAFSDNNGKREGEKIKRQKREEKKLKKSKCRGFYSYCCIFHFLPLFFFFFYFAYPHKSEGEMPNL